MKVVMLRHAESKKNLAHLIGGDGRELTSKGRLAAIRLSRAFSRTSRRRIQKIYFSPARQTKSTAQYLKASLGVKAQEEADLRPIYLGRLTGASAAFAGKHAYEDHRALSLWNDGLLDISELSIAGMEDSWVFYLRGIRFLLRIRREVAHSCLVVTRSTLILFWHIKNRRTPAPGDGYRNVGFRYARPVELHFTKADLMWMEKICAGSD